tara:strand:+ start:1056 stop:1517 length:462 start_codon:yes stop_codon:yes gene_type:complete
MNNFFVLAFILFISCNKDIISSNGEQITYNSDISIEKNQESINVVIHDYPTISGFQFDLSQSENLNITSLQGVSGLSEEYEFYVATSINNLRVLAFSLTENIIPASNNHSDILIKLELSYEGFGELGLTNVILSGENGEEIEININPKTITLL